MGMESVCHAYKNVEAHPAVTCHTRGVHGMGDGRNNSGSMRRHMGEDIQ